MLLSIFWMVISVPLQNSEIYKKDYHWLSKKAIYYASKEFQIVEATKNTTAFYQHSDKQPSVPFITSFSFRSFCWPHRCERPDGCATLVPENITEGSCIFVEGSLLDVFVQDKLPYIKSPFKLFTDKTDDQSNPDGQGRVNNRDLELKNWRLRKPLEYAHQNGLLLEYYAVNLHWKDINYKPNFIHCAPIGLETRDCSYGKHLKLYLNIMKNNAAGNYLKKSLPSSSRILLLISIQRPHPMYDKKPDRDEVYSYFNDNKINFKSFIDFHDKLSHENWLSAIGAYRFTLAPHGHGLDTHRMYEILLMGGIPIIKRSTISSCYDNSDNSYNHSSSLNIYNNKNNKNNHNNNQIYNKFIQFGLDSNFRLNEKYFCGYINVYSTSHSNTTTSECIIPKSSRDRGNLPVVVVDRWKDVTEDRLLMEWERIKSFPPAHWDWRRLFIGHWLEKLV
eukprot:gene9425-19572_t